MTAAYIPAEPQRPEPLYNIGDLNGQLDQFIYTPGKIQTATINVSGELKKTFNITPFNLSDYALQDPLLAPLVRRRRDVRRAWQRFPARRIW